MNAFASLLLAFPLYLAVHGKLAAVVALAKPGSKKTTSAATAPQASPTPAPSSEASPSANEKSANITDSTNSAASYMSAAESVMAILS